MGNKNTNLSLAYTKVPSTTLWITSISNACVILALAPFMIYYLKKFNSRKKEIFIQKRYPSLVIYANLPWTILLTILATTNSIRKLSPLLLSNHRNYIISGHVWYSFLSLMVYYTEWLHLARFWLIFFNLNHAKSNMNQKWKVHLDPNLIDKDFWQKYKNNLGSERFVIKLSIIGMMACLLCVCSIVIHDSSIIIIHDSIARSYLIETTKNHIIAGFYTFFITIVLTLFIKSPQIFDVWDIRQEMKLLIVVVISSMLLNGIGLFFKNNSNKIISLIAMLWSMNITLLCGCGVVFISTYNVLRTADNKFTSTSIQQKSRSQKAKELERVLLDPNNFELFVQHVLREFAVETILSFIEMVQFKHLVNEKFNMNCGKLTNLGRSYSIDEKNIETDIKEHKTDFYDSEYELLFNFRTCDITRNSAIPKSSIVYNVDAANKGKHSTTSGVVDDTTDYLKIICKLGDKYICVGKELEINISGALREQYLNEIRDIQLMIDGNYNGDKHMEAIDLFEYFDAIIEEMYHLLTATCDRFLDSDPNVNIARIHLTDMDTTQIESVLSGKHTNKH